jgi:hypothetical protein
VRERPLLVFAIIRRLRRGTQVVRERSAKPLCVGSIPTRASRISVVNYRGRTVGGRSLLQAFTELFSVSPCDSCFSVNATLSPYQDR